MGFIKVACLHQLSSWILNIFDVVLYISIFLFDNSSSYDTGIWRFDEL